MATAPAPATSNTMWRSGSRHESVASRNSSIPPSRTQAIGTSALISQLMRNHGNSGSWIWEALASLTGPVEIGSFSTKADGYAVLKNPLRAWAGTSLETAPATSPVTSPAGREFRSSGRGTGLVILEMVSGISVQSGQQIRDSEEGEHHDCKAENGEVSCRPSAPASGDAHVQVSGIDEPGNRRPRLFGVPVPVRTPGAIRPVGAGGDHQGEQGERNANSFVSDAVEGFRVRKQTLEVRTTP